ncbi:MAG: aminopeptidase [Lachnospiraceae bacterium]|nr:aminopeptidase [Lachnospiraceae bacterium]MCI1727708.1 aminopeptidase [Lachnospiraceae bacterium]
MSERYELARDRIFEIPQEKCVPEPFRDFFLKTADFLIRCLKGENGEGNRNLYRDILPENYDKSYGNPGYAVKKLGDGYGQILSALLAELYGIIPCIFEQKEEGTTILLELFLEYYGAFSEEELPSVRTASGILISYAEDYLDEFTAERIDERVNPENDFAKNIILTADFSDLSYLERFGEYVTEETRKTAAYIGTLPQEQIDELAGVMAEGYCAGFLDRKLLQEMKTYSIRFELGFERIIRAVILAMRKKGFEPAIGRCAYRLTEKRQALRIGYFGAIPNRQFDYDHRNDLALILDEDYVSRRLRAVRNAYEKRKAAAEVCSGPICLESYGDVPFSPKPCSGTPEFTDQQQKYYVNLTNETGQITDRYQSGDRHTFTIMDLPVPAIGKDFTDIFAETVKINTLDSAKYGRMQQKIIDALDEGESVHILGRGKNRTDLTVALQAVRNPKKQTKFENCVADVNIPVGEVFTSPKLAGTNGILHVTRVFLEGLDYRDLEIRLKDGMIEDYSCGNFEEEKKNRAYIEENILFHHKTLPIGEFAIGTNTTAYVMARKYGIEERMPILIAEKTGPHFAMGDTCYSWREDTAVFNPDGKEIIARDNEVSLNRKTDLSKAYFNCHTDITIPYDELGSIRAVRKDGSEISILENGRFVLPGTEELNVPLDEE